jgi:DNA-binding NtrC family response regulator
LHDDVVIYFLYERYRERLLELIVRGEQRAAIYSDFRKDVAQYLGDRIDAAHLFACFHQVRRAFHHIFQNLVGRSLPMARLRAAIWQSIFTHDVRRYRRSLWSRMSDVSTLITGPTGTGKELVARAIALSRYVPFDERRERFAAESAFTGINLSALSPTLIESELFGHRKGSFTGALADHEGFLESCGALGTVFLDEIGEVDPGVQVKLLRVIQSRTFQRLGDTATRRFEGKLMHEQLAGDEHELEHLVRFIASRVAGEEEADALCEEVVRAIEVSPGRDYRWPGNFRELEQCVRSVMLRGSYEPATMPAGDARQRIAANVVAGTFDADELLRNYTTLLYAKSRNYSQVAEKLGLDRRTVRARVDEELLNELSSRA